MSDLSTVSATEIIRMFVKIRDKRSDIKQAYEVEDGKLKEAQRILKAALLKKMSEVGTEQLKGADGVGIAYRQLKRLFSCPDWPTLWGFIKENDRFDMLQKRIGEKAVGDFLDETGELPPGVTVAQEYDVVIRRS